MLVMAEETSSLICIDEIPPAPTDQKKSDLSDEDYFNKMIGKRQKIYRDAKISISTRHQVAKKNIPAFKGELPSILEYPDLDP